MISPSSPAPNPKTIVLVVGIVAAVVVAAFLLLVVASSSSSGGWSSSPYPCAPPATPVGPTIVSCTGIVTNTSLVTSSSVSVSADSLNLVFVNYVNALAGGGAPLVVTDSLGDSYSLLASTGFALNHTEDLYGSDVLASASGVVVSVAFSGGETPQGGSVASVDVANATLQSIDGLDENTGFSGTAFVTVMASHPGDLFLLGTGGRGVSGPYSPGPGETLLATGAATSGPFMDGTGYGTFAMATLATEATLSANLNTGTWWDAVGVAIASVSVVPPPTTSICTPPTTTVGPRIESCTGVISTGPTVTSPSFSAAAGSLNIIFVSYVNAEAGGGAPSSIIDSLDDSYTLLGSTGFDLNHTENVYAANVTTADAALTVSVTFAGGATPQGGSVATVDVLDSTLESIANVTTNTGLASPATVTVGTGRAGDLFLLGAAGRGVSGPYTPGTGESLLDTGTATAGPFEDGVGYGTFALASVATSVTLTANLNYSTYWEAIGVAISSVPPPPPPAWSVCTPPASLFGPPIVSCAGNVSNPSPVTTLPIPVLADSLSLVFVSYVNYLAGGGGPEVVSDSLGDSYSSLASTGYAINHTEALYAADVLVAAPHFTVSVTFGGSPYPQGGSVAVVDVMNATTANIDGVDWNTGTSSVANVTVTTSHAGDLFLLGTAGRGVSAPYRPGAFMALLDTGTNTSGPFQDGTGYGTFMNDSLNITRTLTATLNVATGWDAIGVAIAPSSVSTPPVSSVCTPPAAGVGPKINGCAGAVGDVATVTTPKFLVTAGSLDFVFVSYVNYLAGGGGPEAITDSLGDTYSLVVTTGFAYNHTESLYAADVTAAASNLTVSVTFGGGATLQGGSVAAVDVAGATMNSVDATAWAFGSAGPANVTLNASESGELFLLGAAGRGVSGPYSAGPNETLLDTGTATAGPFEDGVGYGTFSIPSTATTPVLSANLNVSTYWVAIGASITTSPLVRSLAAHTGVVDNNSTVVTAPIHVAANSLVLLFVSYVNYLAGGGGPEAVGDSSGDSYTLLATTGMVLNHTENLYATHLAAASASFVVSVTFGGGATPQGGSVAVVDVTNATLGAIDAVGETTGTGAVANLTLTTSRTGDLVLFGTAGRGVSAPYSPGPGMTLLDTGTNTSGPFLDGTGYGTFTTTPFTTSVLLSADLNVATGWDAIGIAIMT